MATKTLPDLDAMSFQELTDLIEIAESKRAAKHDEAKAALMAEFQERAKSLGMSLEALRPSRMAQQPDRKVRKDAGATVAPKFRGPDGATWTGRGRKPGWLTRLEAQGRKADDFRI